MGRTTFRRASATFVAATLVFAACGDDDTETAADDTSTTTMVATTAAGDPAVDSTVSTPTSDDDAPPADDGTVIEVSIADGTVEGGGRTAVELGDTVTILITSDMDDHIHLHGYDVLVDVTAGEPAELTFEATIPGVFEVELEDSRIQLLELEIS